MADKVTELGVFDGKPANHVLVNEYVAGQGIMVSRLSKDPTTTFVLVLLFVVWWGCC